MGESFEYDICYIRTHCLREAMSAAEVDLAAAATLAELAGVDAVRLGVTPDLKPVSEEDLQDMRRAARRLELRMAPSQMLLPVALATQPDQVLLAADAREGRVAAAPLDLRTDAPELTTVTRALIDAGITVHALVSPTLDAVKRAHAGGIAGVELYTGALVDLPRSERAGALIELGDAARLAAKLKLAESELAAPGFRYRSAPFAAYNQRFLRLTGKNGHCHTMEGGTSRIIVDGVHPL